MLKFAEACKSIHRRQLTDQRIWCIGRNQHKRVIVFMLHFYDGLLRICPCWCPAAAVAAVICYVLINSCFRTFASAIWYLKLRV